MGGERIKADSWISDLRNGVKGGAFFHFFKKLAWGSQGEYVSSILLQMGRTQVGTVYSSLYICVRQVRMVGVNLR